MAKELVYMNLLTDMQQVIHHVETSGDWVVVVCPDSASAESCAQILAASLPKGARFSGRTAQFDSTGRISVVLAVEEVFVPEDEPFKVSFLGWTSKNQGTGMGKWQKKATSVMRVGS